MGRARAAIWRLLHPNKFDIGGFSDLFIEELDSADFGDIACCDECHDEYARTWPGIVASNAFQSESVPLDWFFTSSAFAEIYTLEEFLGLCEQMGCPACGRPLKYNIWPQTPSFNITADLESEIQDLAALVRTTPFLALTDPLGHKVLDEISRLGASISPSLLRESLFRARGADTPADAAQFMPPPPAVCTEGRFNHAGRPVLYLASSRDLAFREVGSPPEGVQMAEICLTRPIRLLDLGSEDLESDVLKAVTVSLLVSAPSQGQGWDRPEYTFSRFLADAAVRAGFSAIRYPSVRMSPGYNLVVLTPDASWAEMVQVVTWGAFHPSKPSP